MLDAGWLKYLPRFRGARPDHVRVESSSCCFPREVVSFVRPRELVSFDALSVTRFPTTGVLQWRHWSFLLFPQAKHLQFVSGVDAVSFWLATYAWDFINYLLPMFGIIIMFAAFQVDSLKDDLGAIVLLLVIILKKNWFIRNCYFSATVFVTEVSKLCFDTGEGKYFSLWLFCLAQSFFLSQCLSVLLFDVMNYSFTTVLIRCRLKLH